MKSRVLGLSLAAFLAMTGAAAAADAVGDQGAVNFAPVMNGGVITSPGMVGDHNSLGVSATGAAAQISVTNVNQGGVSFDSVLGNQAALNTGAVQNVGVVTVGTIDGIGSSVSISAVGAVTSAGVTNIGGNVGGGVVIARQESENQGVVDNAGSIITEGLIGTALSTSITGIGAIAQASISNVGNVSNAGLNSVTALQTVSNYAAVTNTGAIVSGGTFGNGTSVSISAVGEAAAVSITNVR